MAQSSQTTTTVKQPASATAMYNLPAQETARYLNAELNRGLTMAEARSRLATYGQNELPAAQRISRWRLLLDQFKDFIVILLIVAAVISVLLGDLVEGLAIIAIVILNAVIGLIQEQRADAALEALKKMAAPEAQALRDGARVRIPARDLVPGDIVYLEAGNYVPADIRLVESFNLQVNESALTGESEAVTKRAEAVVEAGAPLGDRVNTAYSSTLVTYGRGRGIVVGTGTNTEIGIIARMLGEIEDESTPLQRRLNDLGKTLSVMALLLCGMVFVVEVLRNTDIALIGREGIARYVGMYSANITDFFILAVSLAVAAVPEGLAAIVTINLALGMREMVKRNALIRRLSAVETLGSTTTICTDKTGTLTQNAMNVVRLYAGGRTYSVTGDKYEPNGEIRDMESGKAIDTWGSVSKNGATAYPHLRSPLSSLLLGALLANDAELEVSGEANSSPTYRLVGDPTEGALVVAAAKAGLWRDEVKHDYPRIAEIPFDANRKMMTTMHEVRGEKEEAGSKRQDAGGGDKTQEEGSKREEAGGSKQEAGDKRELIAYTKGAPDIVLGRCSHYIDADGTVKPLGDAERSRLLAVYTEMASEALRALAVATRCFKEEEAPTRDVIDGSAPAAEHNLTFVGLLGMIDPPRPEVINAIKTAKQAGIRTIMITGDYSVTARAIARQIGLGDAHTDDTNQPAVITGAELQAMSDHDLAARVKTASVFARVSPEHKVRIVTAVQSNGNIVAMTGDGVNDAPALKRADIGIAMGISGTDVSKEVADMVLTDDNYASIVSAIEYGRIIYSNIRKFVFYLLGCNLAEILIIFIAVLLGLRSPLTAIQLLWLNLLTDGAPALALGLEKGDPDRMRIPPRPVNEPIINRRMILGMLTQNITLAVVVLAVYSVALNIYPDQAQTIGFLALCFAELPLAYTARSERFSLLSIGPFSNRVMQYAVLTSVVGLLFVTYVPFMNGVFDTTPLGAVHWLLMMPAMILPACVAEATKLVARRLGWN